MLRTRQAQGIDTIIDSSSIGNTANWETTTHWGRGDALYFRLTFLHAVCLSSKVLYIVVHIFQPYLLVWNFVLKKLKSLLVVCCLLWPDAAAAQSLFEKPCFVKFVPQMSLLNLLTSSCFPMAWSSSLAWQSIAAFFATALSAFVYCWGGLCVCVFFCFLPMSDLVAIKTSHVLPDISSIFDALARMWNL